MTLDQVIVCAACEDLAVPAAGSVQVACQSCGRQVWLSPSSLDQPGRRVCEACADEAGPATEMRVTQATLDELAGIYNCTADQAFARAARHVLDKYGKELKRA